MKTLHRLVDSGRGALLIGPVGVGKSRLLKSFAASLEPAGFGVEHLAGVPGGKGIPFGAVSHLLSGEVQADRTWLLRSLLTRFAEASGPSGLVVAIDDADLLDEPTTALLRIAVDEGVAVLMAAIRVEDATDPELGRLWTEQSMERLQVAPLERDTTTVLVEAILGAKVSIGLAAQVWEITRGNPLFVKELLDAGEQTGTIVSRDGFKDVDGTLTAPERLQDLMERRMRALDSEERRALNAVVLSEPARVELVSSLTGLEPLVGLEQRNLIAVETRPDHTIVRSSHPLLGETVRARLGGLERRVLLQELSGAIESGDGAPGTALRLAGWQLEAGEQVHTGIALEAARAALARFDPELAQRLIEEIASDNEPETLVVLGRALSLQGKALDAESALRKALTSAQEPTIAAAAASALAETYLFGMADAEQAIEALEIAMSDIDDVNVNASLEALAQLAAAYAGDFNRTLTRAPGLFDLHLDPSAEVPTRMIHSLGQTMVGRLDGVMEGIDRAEKLVDPQHFLETVYAMPPFPGGWSFLLLCLDCCERTKSS